MALQSYWSKSVGGTPLAAQPVGKSTKLPPQATSLDVSITQIASLARDDWKTRLAPSLYNIR